MENNLINNKSLENLGRKIIKEIYKFLHAEYILTFEEMKVEKDKIEKYLLKFYSKIIDDIEYESLDNDLIIKVLNNIELHPEINEDLYKKKKFYISFQNIILI